MDEFTCSLVLDSDELMFLYEMCKYSENLPKKILRLLDEDQLEVIRQLTWRLENLVKSYQSYLKNHLEVL